MSPFLLPCLLFGLGASAATAPSELYSPLIQQKVNHTAQAYSNSAPKYPEYTNQAGIWQNFGANTWTTGFLPATLYALNTRASLCGTSDGPGWLALGRTLSDGIVPVEVVNTLEHDVGFVSYPFVAEYLLDPTNQTAKTAITNFANDLANRYSPIVGCTRSWDNTKSNAPTDFQVIMDNMMNLEVLFYSNEISANQTLIDIATSHADHTLANHVRADGSSFHVVIYNSTTGNVALQTTAQGYSPSSTWSRGQSWGIFGFANMYKRTQNKTYLDASRYMAHYFLNNIPTDTYVVPWDFNAPVAGRPADSSAANVAATALLTLSTLEDPSNASYWSDAAIGLLNNVTTQAWKGNNSAWQSLLSNGTVNNRASPPNNMTGIVYGDYYYITAGNMLLNMSLATCNSSSTGGGGSPSTTSAASTRTHASSSSSKHVHHSTRS